MNSSIGIRLPSEILKTIDSISKVKIEVLF